MFKRHAVTLMSNPQILRAVDNLEVKDFQYYDKDGFELNRAEQKYYAEMNFPIGHQILNHCCWQEPWFELESQVTDLVLDHSMFLCRCSYNGTAREQLLKLKVSVPTADYLLRTKAKWGYDFALDAVREEQTFEVLHVEYDHVDYDSFKDNMLRFDYIVRHTDWYDAADRIWAHRDQWQTLKGFAQNDWKAKFLLSWTKAEYTEKTV